MPPKKKNLIGNKKDKENEKKKKKLSGASVDAAKLMKELIKLYDERCEHYNVAPVISIRKLFKTSMEESKLLHRFLIDPKDRRKVEYWEDDQLPEIFAPVDPEIAAKKKKGKKPKKEPSNLVKILPLLEALRNKRYIHIQELFVWEVLMEYNDIYNLAGMISRSIYQFIRIELVDCYINSKSLYKLAPTLNFCRTLQEICLDYNEFGDEGCKTLCLGLEGNRWLLQLSLCYCELTKLSGLYLGELVAKSPIRELFLDGNELQAEGAILLVDKLSIGAEVEGLERQEQKRLKEEAENAKKQAEKKHYNIDEETKPAEEEKSAEATVILDEDSKDDKDPPPKSRIQTKKGKKKNKNALPPPPPAGPQINSLRLADNGIDQMGRGGNFAPMRFTQLLKTIIANSKDLEEIDLFGNDIGDLGSRQLLEGLMLRKQQKLPQIGMRVGHRINQDTFDLINKLAPGAKKKKKKR